MRHLFLFCFLTFTFLFTGLTDSFAACGNSPVYAVWAAPQGEGKTLLYYAIKTKNKWTKPIQLSLEQGFHITPVIAVDSKGTVWIVWIEQKDDENVLSYAVIRQDKIETGRVLANTKAEQSYAPVILIDQQDKPWLAWSGVQEGQLADIYVSSWQDKGWGQAVLVNQPNKTPDITPLLGLREGKQLWVSWFGINQQKIYVHFTAELHDGKWQTAKETRSVENLKAFISQRTHIEPFPEQAGTWLTGALFSGLDCEIQSINERFASFHNTGDIQ